MKKLIILLTAIAMFSSCDFIRTVASRPTSSEIAAKRVRISLEEAVRAGRMDSVSRQTCLMEDSLKLEEKALERCSSIISSGNLSGLEASRLKYRYYIVIGSFSRVANADRLEAAALAKGYPVTRISFNNGYSAVALCGSNILKPILDNLDSLRKETFCPADVWILKNE